MRDVERRRDAVRKGEETSLSVSDVERERNRRNGLRKLDDEGSFQCGEQTCIDNGMDRDDGR